MAYKWMQARIILNNISPLYRTDDPARLTKLSGPYLIEVQNTVEFTRINDGLDKIETHDDNANDS